MFGGRCAWLVALLALVGACGDPPLYQRNGLQGPGDGGSNVFPSGGMGGAASSGGGGSGGLVATGGAGTGGGSTGGATTTGGVPASTGGTATGGLPATGGAATGGSATGGVSTGGSPATGGMSTGGLPATGGSVATGGMATGGMGTGGAKSTSVTGALIHYAFDEASGTVARDDAGSAENGTMVGATFAAGKFGNAASLHNGNPYVALPAGTTSSLSSMTFAFWINLTSRNGFQRLADFGNGPQTGYWFLTPSAPSGSNSVLRFAITQTDLTKEQRLDGPVLPLNQWKHVALVLGSDGATIYVDGVAVANNASLTLRPKDLGALANAWLGRSQFSNDPYLDGLLDDVYLFGRALSSAEIASLVNGP